jgi:hypothetical protein
MERQEDHRRRHIEGFVNAFVNAKKRERYRTLLLHPKRRHKITERLNHDVESDLALGLIVAVPPRIKPSSIAYLISDCRDLDDTFCEAEKALEFMAMADFGTVVSIVPGTLAAVKAEAPSVIQWLYRSS